jgi:hypothetical protein
MLDFHILYCLVTYTVQGFSLHQKYIAMWRNDDYKLTQLNLSKRILLLFYIKIHTQHTLSDDKYLCLRCAKATILRAVRSLLY